MIVPLKWPGQLILLLGCLFWMARTNEAIAAPPTLTHLFPAGGQRGSKVVVTCSGSFTWPAKFWSTGIDIAPSSESGKIEVSIPADLAADRIWIRLYNDEGTSMLQPFLIGTLNEINETEPNDRPGGSQSIAESSVTINGALKERDVDCFAVRLDAGQTLVCALDANTRLGSPMDAILQVVTPEGVVLAENHDDLKLDPRLPFTARQAGIYVVRLFAFPSAPGADIRLSGGPAYIYRLTLTTGPYVTHAIPLSVPLGNPGAVSVSGWNIPNALKLSVVQLGGGRLPENQEFELLDELRRSPDARIGFAFADKFAATTRVRMTPQSVVLEDAESKEPMKIQVSSSITGCLRSRREVDEYRLPLSKGQPVVMSVEARSLDLPLDPVMKLVDPSGTIIADVDDTGPSRDAIITHTAAKDGEYRLNIKDRYGQGGERCWYLLTVRNEEPDFNLAATVDSITVSAEKPAELVIKVQRTGSVGAISIEAIGLPAEVKSVPVISEASGATAAEVKLVISSNGPAFSGRIRIRGKASLPKEIERFARTPARLGVAFESFWLTAIAKP